MSDLGIYFSEDVTSRLLALHQANKRALALAERYGMDAEAARLCRDVYAGALGDVALAFGLVLTIPKREGVSDGDDLPVAFQRTVPPRRALPGLHRGPGRAAGASQKR